MSGVDIDKFLQTLRDDSLPAFGKGRCAKHVRLALEAAGARTAGHPVSAKDWGPILVRNGFQARQEISKESYLPVKGDIVVMQATSTSAAGHIQAYNGKQWISDFVQTNGFWPGPAYRFEKPSFIVYRAQ